MGSYLFFFFFLRDKLMTLYMEDNKNYDLKTCTFYVGLVRNGKTRFYLFVKILKQILRSITIFLITSKKIKF